MPVLTQINTRSLCSDKISHRERRKVGRFLALLRVPELNSLVYTVELGTQLDTEEWNRLRWQCRRGLLELDLVLERFLEKYGDRLQGERLSSFQTLLTYTDNEIWDLIRAHTECRDARFAEVVQWMRNCRDRTDSRHFANSKKDDDGVHS